MAVLGWAILVLIAMFCTLCVLVIHVGSTLISGKPDLPPTLAALVITIGTWYAVYVNCPFQLVGV
ncbi:MAG: hypothetical protein [Podoviridae sp. ctpVR23]|nr:MAG: hypothetical protein [Podoviridae sp. ctpVR23]